MKVQSNAYQKFIHQSPRKLRLVADAIRGMKIAEASDLLKFSSKRASDIILKTLTQAKANIINTNPEVKPETIIVKEIIIEEGPRIKRWRPVSRGMAHSIIKRTSHLKMQVEAELNQVKPAADTKKKKGK